MAKPRGLGKGLDALFQTEEENQASENEKHPLAEEKIDIRLIDPNRGQPRSDFKEDAIHELARSIKLHGVLQPIVLRESKNRYIIVAGERRWRAAKIAGLTKIPAIIRNLSKQEAMEIALIENLQRENLNVIEEAVGIQRLIRECNMTQEQAAERLGKSRSAIANVLRLLLLPEKVKKLVMNNQISAGHARALLGLKTEEEMSQLADDIVKEKLSVRETEQRVKSFYEETLENKKKQEKSIYIIEIEEKLKNRFATKVNIAVKENKKVVQIECYNDEDLNRIIDELL